jgi:hypothetical protein
VRNRADENGIDFALIHAHMVALHCMHYNYCRVHQTLRVTPALQAGLTDHVWGIEELVALIG